MTEEHEPSGRRESARYVFIAGIATLVLAVVWILLRIFVVNFATDVRPL